MIARVWRGVTAEGRDSEVYLEHLTGTVLPSLERVPGYWGAEVIRRSTEAGTEYVVTTRWDSMDAVRAFAGDDPQRAVVEPEARAVLTDFDEEVRHYDVVHRDGLPRAGD